MDEREAASIALSVRNLTEKHGNPAAVVIDTLHRNMGDGDENSAGDIATFLGNIDKLIRGPLDCAVLIVHHSGHMDKSRSRGSSAIRAALDGEFCLRFGGEQEHGIRLLTATKMKDSEPPEPLALAAEVITLPAPWIDEETITPLTSLVLKYTKAAHMPRSKPVTGATRIALEALQTLLQGEAALPPPAGAPEGVTATVPEDAWREECYLAGISDGDKDAKRQAFHRARQKLTDGEIVFCQDGVCWTGNVLPIGNSLRVAA